jgi:hypothetical protein
MPKAVLPIAATFAIIAAAPVLGAETMPVPDFSGPWGRHAFDFEPMPSGPQPLVNLQRNPDGTNNLGTLVGDYRNPILKPEAAEAVKAHGMISLSGHAYPDPSNQCRPYAPPFTFAMQLGLEMLQKKDGITIIYNQDDQVRRIRLNAQHPAHVVPSAMGDSVGHYEGDTLVVDTVGIETGPYTMVDRWGTLSVDRGKRRQGGARPLGKDRWARRPWRDPHRFRYVEKRTSARSDRRRPGRLHHALVGPRHLPARAECVARAGLRREPGGLLRRNEQRISKIG